ncbi:hypothetical protein MSTE_00980 [Mycobacteroides stephanolepidis]|uniref:HNH domain-containing protein n=1 Tax=[Mycobacterium] stephanolepidis TaxID=1520670 RepID=A0A1Z4ETP4_9MYCO|nr:HNH endonuclease [[Mycobacterium] stephanolepidis]BAX96315.1 hypothetical protein MSTE_00980 [[Mycobacterium] stephanolepidis]
MPERVNDARIKRIRTKVRARKDHCHICGNPIDYQAHHHLPNSFQLDHLWQVALGGPEHDIANCAASHRHCNRQRSDKIDATTITAAAHYGVTISTPGTPAAADRPCGTPNAQHCDQCTGTHNPQTGVTFVTARNWWSK